MHSVLCLYGHCQKKPNWCTLSLDKFTLNDKIVDFSEVCREHDVCYWTIDAGKENCDKSFYDTLKRTCDLAFPTETVIPIETTGRQKCYNIAGTYNNAVSGSGLIGFFSKSIAQDSYDDAQGESKDVKKELKDYNITDKKYNPNITWELARRQASGESESESISNTVNTIRDLDIQSMK